MTLSTHVFIQAQADPLAVFAKCNEMLDAPDTIRTEDESSKYRATGVRTRRNIAGQGLSALLWMHYGTTAPIRADGDACSEDCQPEEGDHYHDPMHWIDVNFDTAYGYVGPEGGCGALHARLVAELGMWLDEQGIPWCWKNEFDGAIYGGDDRYRMLTELVGSGQKARQWSIAWSYRASRRWPSEATSRERIGGNPGGKVLVCRVLHLPGALPHRRYPQ